jgi:hypothetical protein
MDFHVFSWISMVFNVFGDVLEPGCLAARAALCQPETPCGGLWPPCGSGLDPL